MIRPAVVLVVAIALFAAVDARQAAPQDTATQTAGQVPPASTGILAGKVVDGSSGAPIAEVGLTLSGASLGRGAGPPQAPGIAGPPAAKRTLTDAQGRFLFRDLPPGSFSIAASVGGYMTGATGVTRPGGPGQNVTLAEDGRVLDLVVRLFKFATISGSVTDEAGEPVVSVYIRWFKSEWVGGRRRFTGPNAIVTTDDRGMYRIPQLAPGDYAIGFIASPISMPAEALVENERVRAGGNTKVAAFNSELGESGANLFTQPGSAVGDWRLLYGTNARPPAATEGGDVFVYPTTFHAGSPNVSGATVVSVQSGEQKTGVDFQIQPAKSARVSGIVAGPDGPMKFFGLRLVVADVDQFATEGTIDPAMTMTDSSGRFTFFGISPGSYALKAVKVPDAEGQIIVDTATGIRSGSAGVASARSSLWATAPVQVSGADVTGVSVVLREGARVSGHAEFEGATPAPTGDRLKVTGVELNPSAGTGASNFSFFQVWRGRLSDGATFESAQLPPGRYFIRSLQPPGWILDSITAGGRDVTDVALELGSSDVSDVLIKFIDKASQLTGVAHNAQRQADPGASIILFPADQSKWVDYSVAPRRLRITRASATGSYTLSAVPPGDYFLAAIADADAGSFPDPKFLAKVSVAATRLTVERGQSKTQDLTTATIK